MPDDVGALVGFDQRSPPVLADRPRVSAAPRLFEGWATHDGAPTSCPTDGSWASMRWCPTTSPSSLTTTTPRRAASRPEAGDLLVDLRARLTDQGVEGRTLKDEGDRQAHELITAALAVARPDDAVLSEEGKDDEARLRARSHVDRRSARRHPGVLRAPSGGLGGPRRLWSRTSGRPRGRWPCPRRVSC